MKTGKLQAKDVLNAYTLQAIKATEETNCVTEFLYDEALEMAENLDKFEANLY